MTRSLRDVMSRILVATLVATGTAARADQAEPGEESALTWKGITLYGVVDIGLQYQTHGAPASDFIAYSTEPVIQKNSNRSVTALTSSPLSWSRIGLSGNEPLGGDWSGVFRLETYFNPTSGDLSDGLRSLTLNNGRALTAQTANLDSSVAGQLFGGGAYAGVSSPTFGTLTFGRQLTPLAAGIVAYDALQDGQDSAHAFSLLGGSRTAAGGGTTEDTRLDHSLKYSATHDWLRVGALYQFGGSGGSANTALQAELGVRTAGASVDAYYAKKYDAISASALSARELASLPPAYSAARSVAATVSDNTAWALMGSYDFGAVKIFGGYERIGFVNPRTPLPAGFLDTGGYALADVNNAAYDKERVLRIYWGGLKWHLTPDFYLAASCTGYQGMEHAVGVLGDYALGRHFDTYLGTLWTEVDDARASGYLHSSTLTTTLGFRVRF